MLVQGLHASNGMKKVILLAILGVAAQPVAADPYITAEAGLAAADISLGEPFNGSIDDEASMYGVNVAWALSGLLAVEAGVSDYGDLDGRGTPCPRGDLCTQVVRDIPGNDMRVYEAALVPGLEIGNLRLYGRAGYYRADIDTALPFEGGDFDPSGLLLGGGLRLHFLPTLSAGLEVGRLGDDVSQVALIFGWHPGRLL